ncbi:MAG TPA: hypothetical protein VE057_23180 [Archangium sp.]|nr:hypothetical protein [Archangium sp.]
MRFERLLSSEAPPATLLIRVMVGAVFLSEGISMLLGSLFLLLVGAGPWSVDARLAAEAERRK